MSGQALVFIPVFNLLICDHHVIRSSNLNSEDAATYLERFRKELEVVDNKLAKDRKRQEQKLHQKLTALKQKRIEEKVLCLYSVMMMFSEHTPAFTSNQ